MEDIQHLPLGFLDWCVSVALFSVKYTIVGVLSSFKLKYQDFFFCSVFQILRVYQKTFFFCVQIKAPIEQFDENAASVINLVCRKSFRRRVVIFSTVW